MPRVRFPLPDMRPQFEKEFLLMASHMNYGNHLGNDRVLTIAQDVRVEWLHQHNLGELDLGDHVGLIQTDSSAMYMSEAFAGQTLKAKLWIIQESDRRCEFYLGLESSEKEVARVMAGMTFFDYQQRKLTKMPTLFSSLLNPS